ncbi:MAG: hypothetical protein ABSB49_22230 [Polyangia bacterium]
MMRPPLATEHQLRRNYDPKNPAQPPGRGHLPPWLAQVADCGPSLWLGVMPEVVPLVAVVVVAEAELRSPRFC